MNVRMSDLQAKDIVNTEDGKKIGRICDLIVDEQGSITYLIVEPSKFLKNILHLQERHRLHLNK